MDATVMQPLVWINFDPLPIDGLYLDKDTRIGNDPAGARQIAAHFQDYAGSLDFFQLENNPAYAFVLKSHAVGTMDEANSDAYLHIFIVRLQVFLLALWFVKDNSANALRAFLRVDDDTGPHVLDHRYTTWFSTADCQERHEHFSAAELAAAVAFYGKLNAVIPTAPQNEPQISGLTHGSRLARSIYLLEAARNTSDLLVKISFYCMCLESLFSTDHEGITYRVAERTALFIGSNGPERRGVFEDVTKLYGTRSKVVHGDTVKENQMAELIERVKRGDGYLRSCLTKILDDPGMLDLFTSKANKDIIEHFRAQVFDH